MEGRSQYRVLLPVDFGDGVVVQPGEERELPDELAWEYRHALMRLETLEDK